MTRLWILAASVLALSACGGGAPEPPAETPEPQPGVGAIAYTGASIWDGTGSPMQQDMVLVVRDGRVEGIVAEAPAGATTVDLAGQFVVPGFVNTHGHVSGRWADDGTSDIADRVRGDLELYGRYGVTTVLSLGGAPVDGFGVRASWNDPSLAHARLLVAGEVVADDTPEAAAATARTNLDNGVDWLKLRVDDNLGTGTKMPWDAVEAAIGTANDAGVPVATHIFYMDDAARLLDIGSGLIAHSVRDQAVTDEFTDAMLESGICYVPTLVREVSTFVYSERPDWFDDPFFLEAAKQSEIDRVSDADFQARVADSPTAAGYRIALVQAQENLGLLNAAGVPIAFGTDSGPAGRFPGYFEHMEFDLMAEAGMTSEQILQSATSVAADCLELDDVGTLETGNRADFVVLGENPLDDISATRSIQSVYIAGNAVDRN